MLNHCPAWLTMFACLLGPALALPGAPAIEADSTSLWNSGLRDSAISDKDHSKTVWVCVCVCVLSSVSLFVKLGLGSQTFPCGRDSTVRLLDKLTTVLSRQRCLLNAPCMHSFSRLSSCCTTLTPCSCWSRWCAGCVNDWDRCLVLNAAATVRGVFPGSLVAALNPCACTRPLYIPDRLQ